jgi:hypothetical protein
MSSELLEIVKQVVRGEQPWNALELVGLQISIEDDTCKVEGEGKIVVAPSVSDFASGFLRFRNDPNALKRWATIVLAASSVIDLRELESEREILLAALWDASSGLPLRQEVFELAELERAWKCNSQ